MHRLHQALPAGAELTGPTAGTVDMTTTLGDHLWLVIATVLTATFVLMIAVFGSLVLAAKAVLANLLSVAASFGALGLAGLDLHFGRQIEKVEVAPHPP